MNKLISVLVSFLFFCCSSYAQDWSELGTGSYALDKYGEGIYTICSDRTGNIYAAGELFDSVYNMIIVKWNGASWESLGEGNLLLDSMEEIDQLITDTSGNLYAVGTKGFNANNVLKWDGSSWRNVGELNANGQISTICFDIFGNLYAAGAFSDTNGFAYVAKWDGVNWSELGVGSNALKANDPINIIIVDTEGNIYAAGCFTDSANCSGGNVYVAKWNGISWSELGDGVAHQSIGNDTHIFTMINDSHGNIYVGGASIIDSGYEYVAKWDGISWNKVGLGSNSLNANDFISSLCTDKLGNLYVGGFFTDSNDKSYVAKWDGATWSELGTGSGALNANNWIMFICSDPYGNIYAGGAFTDTTITLYDSPYSYHPYYVAKYSNPSTSVPTQKISGVNVYPNPTDAVLNVRIANASSGINDETYSLYDIVGRVCRTGKLQSTNTAIDMSELSAGTYILQVGNAQGVYKVVKE